MPTRLMTGGPMLKRIYNLGDEPLCEAWEAAVYTDVLEDERLALRSSLLNYCELDTLAMGMIYEYFTEVVR
jgi:hypothetical protein